VAVYFLYNNLLSVARKGIERGADGIEGLGLWPVHVGLALVVAAMFAQYELYRFPAVARARRAVARGVGAGIARLARRRR
jgi:hypothetical protein